MNAYIYDALRTPRGKARPDGGLATLTPHELVRQLALGINERCADLASQSEALVLGCVGQVEAQGGHIALVSKFHADLPDSTVALTINNYCVSGLTAIGLAAGMVNSGAMRSALAGGVEMMSQVGFMADRASYYTDANFPLQHRYVPVALAADRLATREGISRKELDAAALRSQQNAGASQNSAVMQRSRLPIKLADNQAAFAADECVRGQTTVQSLDAMPAAFGALADAYAAALGDERFDALHTVSHSPPVCDGAALAFVGDGSLSGITPRAKIVAYAEAGGDPVSGLLAGFLAMNKVLGLAGLNIADMDRIEFMESFAVTLVKFLRDTNVDASRVNVSGGHMAKGHPLGASGAILLSTLLDCLDDAQGKFGLVVCTGASGVGAAMIVERLGQSH
jgi:acetyl-CoA C-acetyltransferase